MLRILLAAALTAVSLCGCAVNKTNCHYYKLADCDKELSATVAIGKQLCFELEENITTGYSWQADYDNNICLVQIEHLAAATQMTGAPGKAKVVIQALTPGETVIKLNYMRPFSGEKATELHYRIIVK